MGLDAVRDGSDGAQPWVVVWAPSAEAIRQRIGAWAYGALSEADRPASSDVRRAVGIAGALAELAREQGSAPFGAREERPLWELEVNVIASQVAERSGCLDRDVAPTLELLRQSGVVQTVGERGTPLRIADVVCEPAPGVVRVDWSFARMILQRSDVAGNGMAAPLAVLREIARASGPMPDPAAAPHVRYSVRELEAATLF